VRTIHAEDSADPWSLWNGSLYAMIAAPGGMLPKLTPPRSISMPVPEGLPRRMAATLTRSTLTFGTHQHGQNRQIIVFWLNVRPEAVRASAALLSDTPSVF